MPNSRESSLLRSLAVAFGDGLAFGAGMKLSQRAAAAKSQSAPADLSPALVRIAEIEKRLTESERAPLPRALEASAAAIDDQKVLEAVIAALDARLHEQTGRTESRITELEARLAIALKSLAQHDQTVSSGVAAHLDNLRSELHGQIAELRRAAQDEREAVHSEFIAVHREFAEEVARAVEKRVEEAMGLQAGEFHAELARRDDQIAELRSAAQEEREVARGVEKRVEEAIGVQVGEFHSQLARRDDQIAELRRDALDEREVARGIEKRVEEAMGLQTGEFHAELARRDDQIAELRRAAQDERQAVRSEMVSMNREFAGEVARAVERQVAEAVGRQGAQFRAELAHKDDQIAELREVLVGFAQACRGLVERPAPREKTAAEPEPSNVQVLPDRRAG